MKKNNTLLPIDLVYTWVDSSDKKWNEKLTAVLKSNKKELTTKSITGRFDSHQELKFSLRSIEKYLPWVRTIYIVTDNQKPSWIKEDNSKIKFVYHEDLLPEFVKRPTFNSLLIEFFLHRINGLSNNFIYLNDDFILNRELHPHDFFTDESKPVMFATSNEKNKYDRSLDIDIHSKDGSAILLNSFADQADSDVFFHKNTFQLFSYEQPKLDYIFFLKHAPYAFNKSYCELIYKKYNNFVNLISENQFRSKTDVMFGYLVALNGIFDKKITISNDNLDSFEFILGKRDDQSITDIYSVLESKHKFFCLADGEPSSNDYVEIAQHVLNIKFPSVSSFEIEEKNKDSNVARRCDDKFLFEKLYKCLEQTSATNEALNRHGEVLNNHSKILQLIIERLDQASSKMVKIGTSVTDDIKNEISDLSDKADFEKLKTELSNDHSKLLQVVVKKLDQVMMKIDKLDQADVEENEKLNNDAELKSLRQEIFDVKNRTHYKKNLLFKIQGSKFYKTWQFIKKFV